MIFTFGSNTAGIHGAGAARYAYEKEHMRWGFSYGHCGNAFAIPTKGHKQIRNYEGRNSHSIVVGDTLPLNEIKSYIAGFLMYAKHHPELTFKVTCLGCGLAGFKHEDVAPLFIDHFNDDGHPRPNLYFDEQWLLFLGSKYQYWGTFP